jgi:hypothetical protein
MWELLIKQAQSEFLLRTWVANRRRNAPEQISKAASLLEARSFLKTRPPAAMLRRYF